MSPAREKLFERRRGWFVNRFWIESGMHRVQQGNYLCGFVADSTNLQRITVHVVHTHVIGPDVNLAQHAQLEPRALQEFECFVHATAGKVMCRQRWAFRGCLTHDWAVITPMATAS